MGAGTTRPHRSSGHLPTRRPKSAVRSAASFGFQIRRQGRRRDRNSHPPGRAVRVMIDTVFVGRNRAEIQLSTVAPYALVAQVQAAEARLAVLMAGRAPAF